MFTNALTGIANTRSRPPQSGWLTGNLNITQLSNAQSKWGTHSLYFNRTDGGGSVNIRRGASNLFRSPNNISFGQGTVEFWIYKTTNPSSASLIFDIQEVSTEIALILATNGLLQVRARFGESTFTTEGISLANNIWHHVAFTLDRNYLLTLWANGNRIGMRGSGNAGTTLVTSGGSWWRLGFTTGGRYYINDFRVSTNVRYDRSNSTYTVPSARFIDDGDTYCLFHFDETDTIGNQVFDDVLESTPPGEVITRVLQPQGGNATVANPGPSISTTQSVFGGSSLSALTSGWYLSAVSYNGDFQFGTGNFTVECWARAETQTTAQGIFQFANNNTGLQNSSTGSLAAAFRTDGPGWRWYADGSRDATGSPVTGTWYHIAIERVDGEVTFYVDGIGLASATVTTALNFSSMAIGAFFSTSFTLSGYVDEVRVSNIARYNGNFTVPTTAFTPDSNTKLLLHFNGADGSGLFEDDTI
jgi:hypothetical protein